MTGPPNEAPGAGPGGTPPPIEYAPHSAAPSASVKIGQMMAGTVVGAAVFLGLAFAAPFVIGNKGLLVGALLGVVVLVPLALRLRRNARHRPWAAGIWIGLGIGLLVDGLCWVFMTSMEH